MSEQQKGQSQMNNVGDGFDKFRDELGAEKVDTLMAALGMGPK